VTTWDAIVVGSGPNGLAAALELAEAGRSVLVLEAADRVGGALRSDVTAFGAVRDLGAAVVPFAAGSPFFADWADELAAHGAQFVHPEVCFTHPIDGGRAGVVWRDLDRTVDGLGPDGDAYRRLIAPFAEGWDALAEEVLAPIAKLPRHPLLLARYGLAGLPSARRLGARFDLPETAGIVAGCAAHGVLPLERPLTAAFATLFMASAHAGGWPVVAGGSGCLADAMAAALVARGGEIRTSTPVDSIDDLPAHRVVVFDTDAAQVARIAGHALPHRYRRRLEGFRFGPGVCKVDHLLSGPVPWADPHSGSAGTVHVGGTLDEVAHAEAEVADGRMPERPFVLLAQQSLVDPGRMDAAATSGGEVLWSYTHVPHGSDVDASAAIEAQIERFAPGFRDLIVDRVVTRAPEIASWNRNYVGGDITAGAMDGLQLFVRPRLFHPHRTPNPAIFLCSASTPPGGGVHGMGGRHAARAALSGLLP
jgi:phytoene dehydrogenase-like protein